MAINPKAIILRTSFGITLFLVVLLLLYLYFFKKVVDLWIIITLTLFVFIVLYSTIFFVFKKYIVDKIKVIYDMIQVNDLEFSGEPLSMDIDLIDETKMRVNSWVNKQQDQLDYFKKNEQFQKEFLGNVSHELKTPIFSIQGYLLTLLEGGLYDSNVNKRFLHNAYKSVKRMIRIIEDLNSLTAFVSDTVKLEKTSFLLRILIIEVINELSMLIERRHAKIDIKVTSSIKVEADRRYLFQVFVNLIENALKYSREEELSGQGVKIEIKHIDTGSKFLIKIKDNGQGIQPEHLPRLFERFYRTDTARSRKQGGSGLGLSIVKNIIEAHNQKVTVISTVGKGTEFSFTLDKG